MKSLLLMTKGVILFLSSSFFLAGCDAPELRDDHLRSEIIRPAKLFRVESESQGNIRRFPATTVANRYVDMSFRVAGQLEELTLIEGQEVKKGELLARLDQGDAKSRVNDAEAGYELAQANFDRTGKLLARNLVSQSDYDVVKAQLKTARAALDNAHNNLGYTELHAPFDGIIGRLSVKNFQYVQPRQPILLLLAIDKIDVRIQVPEDLFLTARQEGPPDDFRPELVFPGNPEKKFYVTYKEYASEIDTSTQSYAVTFTLDAPADILVRPGMAAELYIDLDIVAGTKRTGFTIPHEALTTRDSDGKTVVWRYDEETGTVNTVEVSTGRIKDDGVEILSGISSGDQIVAAGVNSLSEGMKVKPLSWERGI